MMFVEEAPPTEKLWRLIRVSIDVVRLYSIGELTLGQNLRIFPAFYGYTVVQHNTEEREEDK